MKIAVILMGLLVTFATAEEMSPLNSTIVRGYAECEKSMNPSEETLELTWNAEGYDNKDVLCFQACMMEKAGIRNGLSVDLDKMESLLRTAENPDEESIQDSMKVFKACKAEAEVSDDECEVMGHFMHCWARKSKAAMERTISTLHPTLKRGYAECKESMNPSEETLKLTWNGEGNDNKDVQCYQACMMEKAGIRNGLSVDLEKMESIMRSAGEPDEQIQIDMAVFKACKAEAEVSDDECEVMGHFMHCWNRKVEEWYSQHSMI